MTRRYPRGGYALPGTTLEYRSGSWRTERPVHRHRAAPCHSACPAGEDAQAYIAQLSEGRLREAWEVLVAANPLPAITGRVCHHPCEQACNRAAWDEPISIHAIERFLGDEAIRHGWAYPPGAPPAPHAPAVAVVGGGPAGLAAAYHLNRRGYRVTIFEMLPAAGGMLRAAIPPYRLPRTVLDAELERLLALDGIELRTRARLGRDVSLDELRAGFRAVFLAPGNQRGRAWAVDGVTPRDLHVGLELLKQWVAFGTLATAADSVAIVGGGNTAVDLARVLKFAGVHEVHVITHAALPAPGVEPSEAMTAIPREIAQAQEEGVIFHPHRGIRRLILRGEQVAGIELVHVKKLERPGGGHAPVAFEGTETVLHVRQVIPAIGQQVDPEGIERLLDGRAHFETGVWSEIPGYPGVYAGGDARGGYGTVSRAIGDGRRAAAAIDAWLSRGAHPDAPATIEPITLAALNLSYFETAARTHEPLLAVAERDGQREIAAGLDAAAVAHEGGRCLSCGNCMRCDNCWTLCPDNAVLKSEAPAADGSHYVFDYDYCKGCGLCARECPTGYIVMEEDL